MNNVLKDRFNGMPQLDKGSTEAFIAILELPDDEFDASYPLFKDKIIELYHSPSYQEQNLERLKFLPPVNIQEEKAEVEQILAEIDADDTLSPNKKEMLHIMFDSTLEVIEQLVITSRTSIDVKIVKLNPDAIIPQYAHPTDAGADVYAVEDTKIEAGETKIVKTGIAVAIPAGYEIQIRPRSGLSAKTKLRIPNAPGTIDTEYRGEIGVIIQNTGDTAYVIGKGMAIAQMLIAPTPMIKWTEVQSVEELGETARGDGGFGSTDKTANAS